MPRMQTTAYCNRLPPAASRWLPKWQSLDGQRWQRRVAIGGGSRGAACYATDKVRAPAGAALRRGAWTNCRRDNVPYTAYPHSWSSQSSRRRIGVASAGRESNHSRPARLGPLKAPARGDVPGPLGLENRLASAESQRLIVADVLLHCCDGARPEAKRICVMVAVFLRESG